MPPRSAIPRLTDIIEAIERVRGQVSAMPLDIFEADWQAQWLAERGIEIISEASCRSAGLAQNVGWVERSVTHHFLQRHSFTRMMPFRLLVRQIVPSKSVAAKGRYYLGERKHIFPESRYCDRCSESNDDNPMFETPYQARTRGGADSNQKFVFLLFVAFGFLFG